MKSNRYKEIRRRSDNITVDRYKELKNIKVEDVNINLSNFVKGRKYLKSLIQSCKFRDRLGCGKALCSRPDINKIVYYEDCFLCVTNLNRDKIEKEVVISSYEGDLGWINDITDDFKITIYHKGNKDIDCNFNKKPKIIYRNNFGREAETISYHIASCYESLADITYFTQDSPMDHSPDFLQRIQYYYEEPTSLTQYYLPNVPPQWIKDRDLVEIVNGFEVRYGDATINQHGDGSEKQPWFNQKVWYYLFDCDMPNPLWFGYGAMWAVPKQNILARPRNFWKNLSDEIIKGEKSNPGKSRTDPPINPWSAEAIWRYIFSNPKQFPNHERFDNE